MGARCWWHSMLRHQGVESSFLCLPLWLDLECFSVTLLVSDWLGERPVLWCQSFFSSTVPFSFHFQSLQFGSLLTEELKKQVQHWSGFVEAVRWRRRSPNLP